MGASSVGFALNISFFPDSDKTDCWFSSSADKNRQIDTKSTSAKNFWTYLTLIAIDTRRILRAEEPTRERNFMSSFGLEGSKFFLAKKILFETLAPQNYTNRFLSPALKVPFGNFSVTKS